MLAWHTASSVSDWPQATTPENFKTALIAARTGEGDCGDVGRTSVSEIDSRRTLSHLLPYDHEDSVTFLARVLGDLGLKERKPASHGAGYHYHKRGIS